MLEYLRIFHLSPRNSLTHYYPRRTHRVQQIHLLENNQTNRQSDEELVLFFLWGG
jgi:hypothetical protein